VFAEMLQKWHKFFMKENVSKQDSVTDNICLALVTALLML